MLGDGAKFELRSCRQLVVCVRCDSIWNEELLDESVPSARLLMGGAVEPGAEALSGSTRPGGQNIARVLRAK